MISEEMLLSRLHSEFLVKLMKIIPEGQAWETLTISCNCTQFVSYKFGSFSNLPNLSSIFEQMFHLLELAFWMPNTSKRSLTFWVCSSESSSIEKFIWLSSEYQWVPSDSIGYRSFSNRVSKRYVDHVPVQVDSLLPLVC